MTNILQTDLVKDNFLTRPRFKAKYIYPKKYVYISPKNASFTKQTPLNCQNFQENAKNSLKKSATSQNNTCFYQNGVKFGLHLTRDPKQFYTTVGRNVVSFSRSDTD